MKKINSFTLSEVLITLVVIGIVAALTVPAIVANYTEKARISRIKKIYSTLANAMTYVKANGGDYDFEAAANNEDEAERWFNSYIKPYLSLSKICYNDSKGCWSDDNTKALNGKVLFNTGIYGDGLVGSGVITAVLNDGSFINFNIWDKNTAKTSAKINYTDFTIAIHFDIDGENGPNTMGKDVFLVFFIPNRGLVPAYTDASIAEKEKNCSQTETSNTAGFSCLLKYLNM